MHKKRKKAEKMNDFVRDNAALSPLKVCVAVLLRTRFLAATAAQLPQDDIAELDTVLVGLLSASGARATRFRDLIALLRAHPFQAADQVVAVYTSAVRLHPPSPFSQPVHICVCIHFSPMSGNRSAKSSRSRG